MTTEGTNELEIGLAEYAELVNGKVAGIDLLIRVMILSTYNDDQKKELLKNLEVARSGIDDEEVNKRFRTDWFPTGSAKVVDGIIDFLARELETPDDR